VTHYLMALDQGTTSTRAIIFTSHGDIVAQHQLPIQLSYPQNAWIEQDPEAIWQTTVTCIQQALQQANLQASDISALGISNQRETTCVWNKETHTPIYPAIVWQDRRTADACDSLSKQPNTTQLLQDKTGLLPDPYFSATKLAWILDHVEGARADAESGKLAFGTIDSFLLWRLTGGNVHLTDATNASRTLLFNINTQNWDEDLLELFNIPANMLPTVCDSAHAFGETQSNLFGSPIPITAILGDQQAATVGQCCFKPGMIKSTYGTGCFMLLNTGEQKVTSQHRLLTTVAYRIHQQTTYALEGSIFMAGATVQWLCDILGLIKDAKDTQALAEKIDHTNGVYLVPAFTGLGAPYWDPDARGALVGLTRDSRIEHIARAALEAVCYQTNDLMQAMLTDYNGTIATLRVDGGMASNDWLLQFLSDILHTPVQRPQCLESSALGAAWMAGLGVGLFKSLHDLSQHWSLKENFEPTMSASQRNDLLKGWDQAIARVVQ